MSDLRLGLTGAVVLALALLVSAGARPSAAQGGVVIAGTIGTPETDLTPEQEQRLLGEYWTVARRFLTGDAAKALAEMSAWTRDRIGKVQSIQYQPEQGLSVHLDSRAEWKPEILRGAALLHTEIALTASRQGRAQDLEFHAGIADGWLALADDRKSAPGSLRARWNVAVARLLLASGDLVLADRQLLRISDRIPGDPAILLAYGTVKETLATRQLGQSAGGRFEDPAIATAPRDLALTAAAALLQKAADAGQLEARLRLSHVHIMKRDDGRAEPLLKDVLAASPPASFKYLASLMLGGIRERQKQMDAAARLYVDAVLAMPTGQSAYLALAHVMHAANQRADAAAVLDRLFNLRLDSPAGDPWWLYPLGLDVNVEGRFNDLRAEIRDRKAVK